MWAAPVLTYAEVGYRVLGLDIDQTKADALIKARHIEPSI